ncbi:TPA: restriction endonuclease subunit S [Escherichia coli]|uniref:restriction endonuclease subunit S n=1 Tax=Escherichia coli TaxID=562 RepID=UPI000B7CCED0|nr:restriction endonuclease subunit S [Escherichia coli]AVN03081.1 restriction endonuclease subunit S [Escherichia coli]EAC1713470.1 restriction endonuclease subunit S [Escherichia coli]EFC1971946.1 restriction endonuclease subunit S [Escherichia coli]EFM2211331.1 restriction endonuclease subunit S [Escherichia coli]EFN5582092.1 restriction endonuclease subunit S [Escherichia coli]
MSELSYLEKLLDGVEVEWKMLGEVIHSLKTGLNPRQNFSLNTLDAQGYYVTVREIQNGKVVFLDKTDRVNDRALKIINGRSNLEAGDILFSGTGTVGRIAVIEENPINWNIKEGVYTIKPIKEKIAPRFLSYLLQSSKIVKDYSKKIVGNPVISLPMGDLKKLLIPIPCPDNPEKSLAIQSEIVRILDKFTALTAELTAELNMRKKQYNYYRDQLFCFDEAEVEWKTLADVAILRRGRVMSKGYLEQNAGDYPVYSSQTARNGMIGSIDTYDFDGEFISWTTDGANAGTVFYRTGKFSITNVCGLIKIHENYPISYKYLYYWLSIEAQKHVYSGMGNPKLMSHQVEKITVPIPFPASPEKSMLEQQRIVGILDKLEAITFSLTEGLPREIELRQKQYEYYRDLLFSFPRPETASN